jgi:hypothetical protein
VKGRPANEQVYVAYPGPPYPEYVKVRIYTGRLK